MISVKILHKNLSSGVIEVVECGKSLEGDTSNDIKTKNEDTVDRICRVCLQEGNIPIYDVDSETICEALNTIGGIQVSSDDPYPKFLCNSCYEQLKGAILLRKTAQESDELLKLSKSLENYEEEPGVDDEEAVYFGVADSVDTDEFVFSENQKKKKDNPNLVCKKCKLDFDTFDELKNHRLSSDHRNSVRTCPICHKVYKAKSYEVHLATHNPEVTHLCDICGKKFTTKGQMKTHRFTHFNELPFKCLECPYRGRTKDTLKIHMRSHTGEKPYICSQCPSSFIVKGNLNKHMLTHKMEKDFKCDLCNRGFNRKKDLEMHHNVDHEGIKQHVCDTCGKEFGYRAQMTKHQRRVHKCPKRRNGRMPLYLKFQSMDQQEKVDKDLKSTS